MKLPSLIKGSSFTDSRGTLYYNNSFDTSSIKRIYVIQNSNESVMRGWQGHKTEQRWFSAIQGEFDIHLIKIDNWTRPSKNLQSTKFYLNASNMDVLHVPSGYVSCIKSKESNSKLLSMSNYGIEEINDEYRFSIDYFELTNK